MLNGQNSSRVASLDHGFGTGEPFSIGVEEELFLVDPLTGRQVNPSAAVLERLPDTRGTIARELHACQVELIAEVCATAVHAATAPQRGTVEIRALDAQTNPAHTASIVALVHCLARHAAHADPEPDPAPG